MAEIRLEHITQSYAPAIRAVDDLSLTVADGELVVLVGPSGCGKTTTLRLIAGLETPTAGLIRIDGRVVNAVPPRQRDVALVFQRPTLYPHLSVEANLAFGVQMHHGLGLWRRGLWHLFRPAHYATAVHQLHDLKSRISDTARVLGLTELLDRRPWQLSGGEQHARCPGPGPGTPTGRFSPRRTAQQPRSGPASRSSAPVALASATTSGDNGLCDT